MSKIIQSGNSLAVTIPKSFANSMGAKKGDKVTVKKYPQKGQLIFTFIGPRQLILSDKFKER